MKTLDGKLPQSENDTLQLTVDGSWACVLGLFADKALRDYLMASLK